MSIGNMNYVRKHYQKKLDEITNNFDSLLERFRAEKPRSKNAKDGYLHIALERHISKNTWAWHGVVAYRKADGSISIRPKSFYGGYAFIFLE